MKKHRFYSERNANQSFTGYGLVGECLAMASILQRGFGCAQAQQDAVDLVAWDKQNGMSYLVQVRSCQESRNHKGRLYFQMGLGGMKNVNGVKKKRMPTRNDFDILALVSTEQRTCFFMPVTAINQHKITKLPSFFDDPEIERESWQQTLEVLNEYPKS